jgi:hypothetical protein
MSDEAHGYLADMSGRSFAVIAILGLLLAAVSLALAPVLDSAVLAVAGALFVAAVLIAREGWLWQGDLRRWLASMGLLVVVVAVAYAVSAAA